MPYKDPAKFAAYQAAYALRRKTSKAIYDHGRIPVIKKKRMQASRRYNLKKYGLTQEQWDALFEAQGRKCAICGCTVARRWTTDHDHANGKHRGILCAPHNAALGAFGDSPELLRAAAIYIEEWRLRHGKRVGDVTN